MYPRTFARSTLLSSHLLASHQSMKSERSSRKRYPMHKHKPTFLILDKITQYIPPNSTYKMDTKHTAPPTNPTIGAPLITSHDNTKSRRLSEVVLFIGLVQSDIHVAYQEFCDQTNNDSAMKKHSSPDKHVQLHNSEDNATYQESPAVLTVQSGSGPIQKISVMSRTG